MSRTHAHTHTQNNNQSHKVELILFQIFGNVNLERDIE